MPFGTEPPSGSNVHQRVDCSHWNPARRHGFALDRLGAGERPGNPRGGEGAPGPALAGRSSGAAARAHRPARTPDMIEGDVASRRPADHLGGARSVAAGKVVETGRTGIYI